MEKRMHIAKDFSLKPCRAATPEACKAKGARHDPELIAALAGSSASIRPLASSVSAENVAKLSSFKQALQDQVLDPYLKSPFLPLKQLSSRKKGSEFEKHVEELMTLAGHRVQKPLKSTEYDRIIDGQRVEIKGSFLWDGAKTFKWQQIRTNQNYDAIIFLAYYPSELKMYAASKAAVTEVVEARGPNGTWIHNQHGGKTINSGTFELKGVPEDFTWMQPIDEYFKAVAEDRNPG